MSMPKTANEKAAPVSARKSTTLVNRLKPTQTHDAATAQLIVAGLASNAVSLVQFSEHPFGVVDLTECLNALVESAERVNRGNLGEAEALLTAQAVTLNAIFTQLAGRAKSNIGHYPDTADRYMRLALKAQGQCRATLETLAAIKNPPVVFARQANIANGPQQVNNGLPVAPAENLKSGPDKLLEAHGERLDIGATGTAGGCDRALAPVGAVNRAANR